jgi:hypothetical protein
MGAGASPQRSRCARGPGERKRRRKARRGRALRGASLATRRTAF